MADDPTIVVLDNTRTVHQSTTATVHEHRAPTDASVKLLMEMEQAAEAKVIEAIHVGNTVFECVVHMERNYLADDILLRAVFKLNGRQMKAEHRLQAWTFSALSTADINRAAAVGIRDEVAKVIATEMIGPAFAEVAGKFRVGR